MHIGTGTWWRGLGWISAAVIFGAWVVSPLFGERVVPVKQEKPIQFPLTQPGAAGVTQNPEVFNYYISVLEKSLGTLPCRAAPGKPMEPCVTKVFEEITSRVTKACYNAM